MFTSSLRRQWLFNVRGDLLAGIVLALAFIPEAIAFSTIAGEGATVEVIGLDQASATLVDRHALHDKPGAVEPLMH